MYVYRHTYGYRAKCKNNMEEINRKGEGLVREKGREVYWEITIENDEREGGKRGERGERERGGMEKK